MKNSALTKTTLILSGLIATCVGFGVLFMPHAFHASTGIVLGDDVNLMNEMRSSGGVVLVSGLFILLGAFRARMAFFALIVSTTMYLSYGLSRVVSLIADGLPGGSMLQILALELFIGTLCAIILKSARTPN